jgi:hypothetical protein
MKRKIGDQIVGLKLGRFIFVCDQVIGRVPVNPTLPEHFGDTANEKRPQSHMAWWGVPYVEIYEDDHPKFVEHWKGTVRYDVRCLDGGAWDRPTCWGMFATLAEAVACAVSGRRNKEAVA